MKIIFKTQEDYICSPFIGWMQQRWIELAEKMIVAIQPYLISGKGGLALPNPTRQIRAKIVNSPESCLHSSYNYIMPMVKRIV